MNDVEPQTRLDNAGSAIDAVNEPLFVARSGQLRALDGGSALWRAQHGTDAHLLTHAEAALIAAAQGFAPRAELLERCRRQAGAAAPDAGELLPASAEMQPLPDPVVAVRTCGRPEALRRLLQSIAAFERGSGSQREFIVIDDSLEPDSNRAARASAEEFARQVSAPVRFLASAAAGSVLDRIAAAAGIDPSLGLAGLLDPRRRGGVATGATTWNWAVLLSAGNTLSILDDDVVFPLRAAAGSRDEFELSNSLEPETHFFDEADACGRLPAVGADPFAYAARYVGQAPGALLQRDGVLERSAYSRPIHCVSHLRANARVAAAFTGSYASIAFNSSVYFNTGNLQTLDHLLRPRYRHDRLEGDNVWQGVRHPRIVPRSVVTPLLLDNRTLRPFTGSCGREDDTLFLHLTKAIDPDALFVFMPAAIGHYPVDARNRIARSVEAAITDTNNFLVACTNDILPLLRSGDASHRLGLIGRYYAELALASDLTLSEAVLAWRDALYAGIVARLSTVLAQRPQAPPQWRNYAEQVIGANRAALGARQLAPEYLEVIRSALRQAASASEFWPNLWRCCAQQRFDQELPVC